MSGPFLHWSRAPLTKIGSRLQDDPATALRIDKPNGLWFSVGDGEDGWRAWCESEGFSSPSFACCTEVIFAPAARLLCVSTAIELDDFNAEYKAGSGHRWNSGINWPAVAESYDAIVIAPYIWSRRLHDAYGWYYGWDCASGCVWSADAVDRLIPRESGRVAA